MLRRQLKELWDKGRTLTAGTLGYHPHLLLSCYLRMQRTATSHSVCVLRQAYVTVYTMLDPIETLSAAPSQLGVALPSDEPRPLLLLAAEPLDACEPLANRSYAGLSWGCKFLLHHYCIT